MQKKRYSLYLLGVAVALMVGFGACSEKITTKFEPEPIGQTLHVVDLGQTKHESIKLADGKKGQILLGIKGDKASEVALTFDGEVPWGRLAKGEVVERDGEKLQVYTLEAARTYDLFPRVGRIVFSGSSFVEVVQPGCAPAESKNGLARFCPANLLSDDGTMAKTPTKWNVLEWWTSDESDEFGSLFVFPDETVVPEDGVWKVSGKMGNLQLALPKAEWVAPFFDYVRYSTKAAYVRKDLQLVLRYQWVENDRRTGLRMTARSIRGKLPAEADVQSDEYWNDAIVSGGDVVRYFPALGVAAGGQIKSRGAFGFHWTQTAVGARQASFFGLSRKRTAWAGEDMRRAGNALRLAVVEE